MGRRTHPVEVSRSKGALPLRDTGNNACIAK